SVIVCVQGVGGLSGGLVAAKVVGRLGEMTAMALGIVAFGVGFVLLTQPNLILGLLAGLVNGVGIPLALVGYNTLMQRLTPAGVIGRVLAAAEALISTPQSLAILLGAVLVGFVDYRLLFALMAVGMVFAAGYVWLGRSLGARPGPDTPATDADPVTPPQAVA